MSSSRTETHNSSQNERASQVDTKDVKNRKIPHARTHARTQLTAMRSSQQMTKSSIYSRPAHSPAFLGFVCVIARPRGIKTGRKSMIRSCVLRVCQHRPVLHPLGSSSTYVINQTMATLKKANSHTITKSMNQTPDSLYNNKNRLFSRRCPISNDLLQ